MRLKRALIALALAVACITPVLADEPSPSAPPAKPGPIPPKTPNAVTHHTLVLNGRKLAYSATAGTITLRNSQGQETARMFYTAYTLDGADASKRPVTFFYNGGPGSSTVWLRMGSFGPVRVVTSDGSATPPAPYRYVDNQYSLLDKTDEVFVDAPGTGYGRLIGAGQPKDFYSVDGDVDAFDQFIRSYITDNSRWNSPKFLFGESYGTTRSAALVDQLQDDGIAFNGVVLQSSILNFNLDWNTNFSAVSFADGDWAYPLYLPTAAATAWYHHKIPNRPSDLAGFLRTVEQFAMNEYLDALAKGATLDAGERADVVQKLHQYTGLSEAYISNSNLRVPYWRFQNELLRGSNITVGRLDSRFKSYNLDSAAERPFWDPADVAMSGAFVATFNQYIRKDLHYVSSLPYLATNYGEINSNWNFKHNRRDVTNVAPNLAAAMTENPHLKVFSSNGYYDFATPYFATVYTLNQLNLAPSIQRNITYGFYQSGHMIYLHPSALSAFKRDLDAWYDSVLRSR